jgi:hypothetical protein
MRVSPILFKDSEVRQITLPRGFIPRGLSLWRRRVILWVEADVWPDPESDGWVRVNCVFIEPGADVELPVTHTWQFAGTLTINDNEVALILYLGVPCGTVETAS